MNQGGILVISSIVGLLAYGQAKDSGWKTSLGELVLAVIGLGAVLAFDGSDFWTGLRQRPDFPTIMLFATVTIAGAVFLIGELLRRRLRWKLLARHVGWIAFIGSYILLNIVFLILKLKEFA